MGSRAGALTLDPGRHEARVGEHLLSPDAHGVPAAGGAGPCGRRPRRAPPAGPRRLARRARPRPPVAQAAPRAPPREARGGRWPAIVAVRSVGYRIEAEPVPEG